MTEVSKHGTHDQQSHAGGRGGGGGGMVGAGYTMSRSATKVAEIAMKNGMTEMQDRAIEAEKAASTANELMSQGKYLEAKEYMDIASDKIKEASIAGDALGRMNNSASKEVNALVIAADKAQTDFANANLALNDLSIKMFNHKQKVPMSLRRGNTKAPDAVAHIKEGQNLVTQAAQIIGTESRERAMDELNARIGS